MELLDKLPREMHWNVIKYLQHPTAGLIETYWREKVYDDYQSGRRFQWTMEELGIIFEENERRNRMCCPAFGSN